MRKGQQVLVLAADLFEDMELLYPVYRLREEEVEVTIAGLTTDSVTGKKGYGPVEVDTTVDEVDAGSFDALVIPGGFAPDKLRRSKPVLSLVEAFNASGKPIAFICHAGAMVDLDHHAHPGSGLRHLHHTGLDERHDLVPVTLHVGEHGIRLVRQPALPDEAHGACHRRPHGVARADWCDRERSDHARIVPRPP